MQWEYLKYGELILTIILAPQSARCFYGLKIRTDDIKFVMSLSLGASLSVTMSNSLVSPFLLPENTSSKEFYKRRDISISSQDLRKRLILEYRLHHP
jgi:hypothetical protein